MKNLHKYFIVLIILIAIVSCKKDNFDNSPTSTESLKEYISKDQYSREVKKIFSNKSSIKQSIPIDILEKAELYTSKDDIDLIKNSGIKEFYRSRKLNPSIIDAAQCISNNFNTDFYTQLMKEFDLNNDEYLMAYRIATTADLLEKYDAFLMDNGYNLKESLTAKISFSNERPFLIMNANSEYIYNTPVIVSKVSSRKRFSCALALAGYGLAIAAAPVSGGASVAVVAVWSASYFVAGASVIDSCLN